MVHDFRDGTLVPFTGEAGDPIYCALEPPDMMKLEALYPEIGAGGFSRYDGHVQFRTRVSSLLREDMTVLDFGAGRGKWVELADDYRLSLIDSRGKCRKVIGADVDPVVLQNPLIDEAVVLHAGQPLPFPDASFDMILSWAVFEHVREDAFYSAELGRVLKPSGWLCAWTPNKWGYPAIAARLIPNSLHRIILQRIIKDPRKGEDIYPTVYRMNTLSRLKKLFPEKSFTHFSYAFTDGVAYHANSVWLARLWIFLDWITPSYFNRSLFIFIRKNPISRDQPPSSVGRSLHRSDS